MSVVEFFSQPLWHRLSLTLVHFLWQGLAVAVLACAAVRGLRLKRGNPRYAAYLVAFAVMTVSPPLTFTLLDRPVPPTATDPAPAPTIVSSGALPQAVPAPIPQQPPEDTLPVGSAYQGPLRQELYGMLQASLPWAMAGWMGGVLILSIRLLLGFLGVRRWRRDLEPLADDLQARVAVLSDRLNLRGFSQVFVSRRALEAVALGYLRPVVLLPAALVTQMQPEMLEAVIAHELAHIRRFDLWVNLAQRVIETLLFYHPAVWWLSNRVRAERELCCDELAVRATGERLTYASALESAGRVRLGIRQPALAVALGQDRKSTLSRVRHILGVPTTRPDSRVWLAGVIGVLVLVVLVIPAVSTLTAAPRTEGIAERDVKPTESLHEAAAHGDLARVEALLAAGADVNAKNEEGQTPLFQSLVKRFNKEVAAFLLDKGANPNAADNNNATLLHVWGWGGDIDVGVSILKFLLERGANVNALQGESRWTPLHSACSRGRPKIAEVLIERGANVEAKDQWGHTPLDYAIRNDHYNTVKVLVAKGVDVTSPADLDCPLLHYAVRNDDLEMVRLCTDRGADFNAKDHAGWTAFRYAVSSRTRRVFEFFVSKGANASKFHTAAWLGDLTRVKGFVEQGADVNEKDGELGWTPLHWAAFTGPRDVIEFLIAKGANVNARDAWDDTPLHRAAAAGQKESVELLLAKGADLNATDHLRRTPLDYAAQHHAEIVDLLRKHGATSSLHHAADAGDIEKIEELIAQHASVNLRDEFGRTPLHLAVQAGHRDVAELLIGNGADVNMRTERGFTPLHLAPLRGPIDVAELLISKGADINAKTQSNLTSLHFACGANNRDMVELLLSRGADVHTRDSYGRTPLHLAVQMGHRDVAERLINKGADINAKTEYNQTPLHVACGENNTDMVELLLSRGADVHARSQYDSAPIHYAAGLGNRDMVERLLAAGADLNVTTGGRTPLYIAICANRSKTVELLAAKGAEISPIHLAAYLGNTARVKTLIEGGADANARDGAGSTPLHNAVCGDSKDVVTLLLEQGADINATGWRQWTPLHHASDVGHTDMVEVLIDRGAKVDLRGENGNTPLLLAAGKGHTDIVRRLLAEGADVNTRGNRESTPGSTPLYIASGKGHKAVVELLLTNGADVNAKTDKGDTALSVAKEQRHDEIVELLRRHGAKE